MSAPVRFLVVAVAGWAAIRMMALGTISGFTLGYARPAPLPPLVPTEFPELPAPDTSTAPASAYAAYPQTAYPPMQAVIPIRVAVPYYVPVYVPEQAASQAPPIPPRAAWHLPDSTSYSLLESSSSTVAAAAATQPGAISAPAVMAPIPANPKPKRWQFSSWAFIRGSAVPQPLATAGQLGGSQAGARLLYNFTRSLAASLRMTSPVGGSTGTELAAGMRWIPLRSIPVAITAERRQSINRYGRSDFDLLVEGGLYRRPLPLKLYLDGYMQAGVVGVARHDLFFDGAMAVSRPLFGPLSAGFGLWGGAQPGLSRLDAGPRVSLHVRRNIYAHFDWRQRVAGTAQPNSGPAVTLAADF